MRAVFSNNWNICSPTRVQQSTNPATSAVTRVWCPVLEMSGEIRRCDSIASSQVSVKAKTQQFLMSSWNFIRSLSSSILLTSDWTFASKILGRGVLKHLFWVLHIIPAHLPLFCTSFSYTDASVNEEIHSKGAAATQTHMPVTLKVCFERWSDVQ